MIPFIRSISELTAITGSRDCYKDLPRSDESESSTLDSGQRKRYKKFIDEEQVELPALPKNIRLRWIKNKENVYRFFNELDYNNQIQSSYDLTLLERQNNRNQQDAA